ncbi:hypothetical protein SLE2022_349490 [Rubroshorea leprosula]
MDELSKAVAQFNPAFRGESALGGMNGGFNPPPTPNNSTLFLTADSHEAGPSASEERREELELRNSKEWRESEEHIQKVESKKKLMAQRAKEIARERGYNPLRCEAVEDAARDVAERVEDIPEKQQLGFLANLIRNLNDPSTDTWGDIHEEVRKWRSWEE